MGNPTGQPHKPGEESAAQARGRSHFLKCVARENGREVVIHRNVICTRSVAALSEKRLIFRGCDQIAAASASNVTDVFQRSNTILCGPFFWEDTFRKPGRGDGQEHFRERVAGDERPKNGASHRTMSP